jgi:hypothetical protein
MRNLITLLFCRFYDWLKDDMSALGLLTLLISTNIFTGVGYIRIVGLQSSEFVLPIKYEISIILAVGAFLFLYFIKRNRYLKMYEGYKSSKYKTERGTRLVVTFTLLTILFLASLIVTARYVKN